MIVIKYSKYNKNVRHIEDRLKGMSMAYQLEQEQAVPTVVFDDGNIRLEGLERIDQELDKLQSELKQWWYCNC
jgi:hypothetical protein